MQWMKSNAASIGIINRISKKVIKIDEHCCEHDEIGEPPAFPKEKASNNGWNYKVQG